MTMSSLPSGYQQLAPYLTVSDADRAIAFYEAAFGATERMRLTTPDGRLGHAEIAIGDAVLMLADENEEWGTRSPESLGGSPCSFMLYVDDVDSQFRQALDAGATEVRPVEDQFYGDRSGTLTDPFGHTWTLGTHTEDVSDEEVQRRWKEMMPA